MIVLSVIKSIKPKDKILVQSKLKVKIDYKKLMENDYNIDITRCRGRDI